MNLPTKKLRDFAGAAVMCLFSLLIAAMLAGCGQTPLSLTSTTDTTTGARNESSSIGSTANEAQGELALVTRVIDGDTIDVQMRGQRYRVRFIGMDTPERGRPYYREATEKTKELVLYKEVRMVKDISETDRYGRLLRYVYVDGAFVNAELVKQGYAVQATFPPDVKYAELFRRLAAEARAEERGLWALPPDERPRSR